MEQMNRAAVELVDEAIDFAEELRIRLHHLDNDAVVLDFGVKAVGGIEAGLLLTEIATGGLATVQTRMEAIAGEPRLHVELTTDHPTKSLLTAGKARWSLDVGEFTGLASGPGQLLRESESADTASTEEAELGVLVIEAATLPAEEVADHIASALGLPASSVYLPTVATASLTGSIGVAARTAEVALHRLEYLGYDTEAVVSAASVAPVAPVASAETALGTTNDAIAYGGRVHLVVREPVDRLSELPYEATDAAGESMTEVLTDHRFEPVEDVFAPAQVTVDVIGGETETVGSVNENRLVSLLAQ